MQKKQDLPEFRIQASKLKLRQFEKTLLQAGYIDCSSWNNRARMVNDMVEISTCFHETGTLNGYCYFYPNNNKRYWSIEKANELVTNIKN